MRSLLIAAALSVAMPALAQFSERVDVVAVEVPIFVHDRAGKVPSDLTKDDFEVLEDGVRQEVIGLTYPVAYVEGSPQAAAQRPRWQIVVFLQESMSGTSGLRRAVKALLDQTETLAALGDVEIVSDYPNPHVILAPTHDANALRTALGELQRKAFGHEEVVQLRKLFQQQTRRLSMTQRELVNAAVFSANIEAALVRRRQDAMLAWLARYAAGSEGTPRLLLLVSDGYSLEPIDFYWNGEVTSIDLSDLRGLTSAPRQDELARTIAVQGWTVYSIAVGPNAQMLGDITELPYSAFGSRVTGRQPFLVDSLDALRILDAETGGKLTTDPTRFAADISSFAQRLTLTYRARHARDGKFHRLDIRALRPGLTVESQHSVMTGSPASVTTARATALAMDVGQRGELPVTCRIRRGGKTGEELDIHVDLTPFAAARASMKASTLRVAIAVAPEKKYPFNDLQHSDRIDLSALTTWQTSIPIQSRGNAPTAVVVEEVATGAWGGARCELQR